MSRNWFPQTFKSKFFFKLSTVLLILAKLPRNLELVTYINSTIGLFSFLFFFFKDNKNREVAYTRKHNLLFKTFKKKQT